MTRRRLAVLGILAGVLGVTALAVPCSDSGFKAFTLGFAIGLALLAWLDARRLS